MSRLKPQAEQSYGLPQPLAGWNPTPIAAKRDPTVYDTGYAIGQLWVNTLTGSYFGLASVSAGSATWSILGNVSSTYTTLTSGSYATTGANAVTWASGNVFTGTGAGAAIGFTFTPKGAGNTVFTTGNVTLSSGNLVLTSGNATLTSGNLALTSGNAVLTNGNLSLGTAGKGISIKSGANARIGQATLVGGTIAVANTSVTASTRVFITRSSKGASTALGNLEAVPAAGVGFTISSYDDALVGLQANDVSVIDWLLVESA